MRIAALLPLLLACACTRPATDPDAETAAVYEAFLNRSYAGYSERVLMQDVAVSLTMEAVADWRDGARRDEVSREYSPEVREALGDLVARSRTPRRLAPGVRVTRADVRVSADSVQALFETIRQRSLRRLPQDAAIVQLSAVGFSRNGLVAAVYENVVCGFLCGGGSVTILRKHPAGWLPAEEVLSVIY